MNKSKERMKKGIGGLTILVGWEWRKQMFRLRCYAIPIQYGVAPLEQEKLLQSSLSVAGFAVFKMR